MELKNLWLAACLSAGFLLFGCAPRATATPEVAPPSRAIATPSPPRPGAPASPSAGATAPTAPEASFPTARPHLYDEVTENEILAAVYPGLSLTLSGDYYQVQGSDDWRVWVTSRDEGTITQNQRSELVAVIANQAGPNPPAQEAPYGPSSSLIVILERKDGKLTVTQRQALASAGAPDAFDAQLERTVDAQHDGIDEVLIATNSRQSLLARTEAYLYRWQDGKFVELWKGLEQDDNTSAENQTEYHSFQAVIDFDDVDHDGKDEIVVEGQKIIYGKDPSGEVDFSAPQSVTEGREVYRWNGQTYVPDPALTTPAAPVPTP